MQPALHAKLARLALPVLLVHGAEDAKFREIAPMRTPLTIDDIGNAALYLCSDLSRAVTGEVLYVDGQNNGNFVALEAGWKRKVGKVNLDLKGAMAMSGQK